MDKKPYPKQDDPEQAKRFIEGAREVGASESEEMAERAFRKVVKKPVILNPPKSRGKA